MQRTHVHIMMYVSDIRHVYRNSVHVQGSIYEIHLNTISIFVTFSILLGVKVVFQEEKGA